MRSIDIHAHLTPQCFIRAMQAGQEWHGIRPGSVRIAPRAVWTPEQRIADMNSLGVDVHVVSTGAGFYYYDRDAQTVAAMHRECNDEVHQMTMDHPGLAVACWARRPRDHPSPGGGAGTFPPRAPAAVQACGTSHARSSPVRPGAGA